MRGTGTRLLRGIPVLENPDPDVCTAGFMNITSVVVLLFPLVAVAVSMDGLSVILPSITPPLVAKYTGVIIPSREQDSG